MITKQIGVITGARSEFGILYPIIRKIIKSNKLRLQLYVSGMHLLSKFGNTIENIRNQSFKDIITIPMYEDSENVDHESYIAEGISKGITNFTTEFIKHKPDIILVLGDRVEILTACIAAITLKIPIAHIHGGDISENAQIDEQIRHAITKFAHLHFPATELSKKRILQMGEEKWRVILAGSPSIEYIKNTVLYSKLELLKKLNLTEKIPLDEDIILCLQHPSIYKSQYSGIYMGQILNALHRLKKHIFLIYPNNDPGNDLIIHEINKYKSNPFFHIYPNLERKIFLSIIKNSLFMIGNSSSAIIETTIFKVPAINIGIRNKNRESANNIIHIQNDETQISKAIEKVLSQEFRKKIKTLKNFYGEGNSSEIIIESLEKIKIDYNLFNKKFVFRE